MADRYAVIGNPVAHSKSPLIHAAFARQTGHDIVYVKLPAPKGNFRIELNRFMTHGGRGLNITVPFKEEAAAACTQLSERAKFAQAANTLTLTNGRIIGDNTDGAGMLRDLENNLHVAVHGRRVLLMGAGGAARGVLMPLIAHGARLVVIANRDMRKARELEQRFGLFGNVRARAYNDLGGSAFDLVINSTSASLQGTVPPLPGTVFAQDCIAYDLVYAAGATTPFLERARDCGAAITSDGLGMLVEQAAESFFIWRGVRPQTRPVLDMLRSAGA